MRRMWTVVVMILIGANVMGQGSVGSSEGAAAFDKTFKELEALANRGNFKAARDGLMKLLDVHVMEQRPRDRSSDIEALHKNCTFNIEHPKPEAKKLVKGELLSYDPSSGQIKIRYKGNDGNDNFENDFTRENVISGTPFNIFPARFRGPHTITIKGKEYPQLSQGKAAGIAVLICASSSVSYLAEYGCSTASEKSAPTYASYPASLTRASKEGTSTLDSKPESFCRGMQPFELKVKVGESEISVMCGGRVMLTGARRKSEWGDLGFTAVPFTEVLIEGKVEPSWIEGKIDEFVQEQRKGFEKGYDAKKRLPSWLFDASLAKATPDAASSRKSGEPDPADLYYPDPLTQVHVTFINLIISRIENEFYDDALTRLAKATDKESPPATRETLFTMAHYRAGQGREALTHADALMKLAPKFARGHFLHARALELTGKLELSIAAWRRYLVECPKDPMAYVELSGLLLTTGRLDEARDLIVEGRKRITSDKDFDREAKLVDKAIRGPEWTSRTEVKTTHFEIVSDLDKKTCDEAAKVLEESYLAYTVFIDRTKEVRPQRMKVFLFSGEAGYKRYSEGVLGVAPMHTSGLYSPQLKQLLIWNVPNREEMMRTVRHEGFHQYFDSVARNPPVWFNEGLAEYYETSNMSSGSWVFGQPRSDHVRTMKEHGLIPLSQFVLVGPPEFYRQSDIMYAQGWAFCHFLLHHSAATKRLHKALWDRLAAGESAADAIQAALPASVLREIEPDFIKYVNALPN